MESKIERLLHKYWEANTSLEEEQELKTLLSTQDDESELSETKELFNHFDTEKSVELDSTFDDELMASITEMDQTPVLKFSDYVKRYSSIAAAILVLFVSSYVFIQQQNSFATEDSFDSPEAAYAELKKQLLMVSHYMNKGNETVNELSNLGKYDVVVDNIGSIGKASDATMEHLKELNRTN